MNKLVAVTQLALCFVFVFCNSGDGQTRPAELVGQWEYGSGERVERPDKMELFKDGTGVSDDKTISWKVENKRFVILSSNKGLSCDYEVSGYGLILFEDNGNIKTYAKKEMWDIFERGKKALNNKKYDEAIAAYSEAIKKDPNNVGGYISRIGAYAGKGDDDKALADMNQAIRIGKKPSELSTLYMLRGMYYFEKKDYDKAIADFELALQKTSSADAKYFGSNDNKELAIKKMKDTIDLAKEIKEARN